MLTFLPGQHRMQYLQVTLEKADKAELEKPPSLTSAWQLVISWMLLFVTKKWIRLALAGQRSIILKSEAVHRGLLV